MERRLDLAAPVIEEVVEDREFRSDIIMLPDEELQQRGMVRHVMMNFGGGEALAFELELEIAARHLSSI
jgi:hypothetical protein